MLSDCATELKNKEAKVEALKNTIKQLQARLQVAEHEKVKLHLEQTRLNCEIKSKDEQLAQQAAESLLRANTSNELAAQLTKQHKELVEAHAHNKQEADILHFNHQRESGTLEDKLEAKDQKIVCLKGKLTEQKTSEKAFETEPDHKIAQLDDNLCPLKQDIEEEAAKRAAELQAEFEKRFSGELTEYHTRVTKSENDHGRLHVQLWTEDNVDV